MDSSVFYSVSAWSELGKAIVNITVPKMIKLVYKTGE